MNVPYIRHQIAGPSRQESQELPSQIDTVVCYDLYAHRQHNNRWGYNSTRLSLKRFLGLGQRSMFGSVNNNPTFVQQICAMICHNTVEYRALMPLLSYVEEHDDNSVTACHNRARQGNHHNVTSATREVLAAPLYFHDVHFVHSLLDASNTCQPINPHTSQRFLIELHNTKLSTATIAPDIRMVESASRYVTNYQTNGGMKSN